MGYQVKVLQKGRVTIPVEIRDRLAIAEGDTLLLDVRAGQLVLSPKKTVADPTGLLSGLAKDVSSRGPLKEQTREAAAMRLERKLSRSAE